MQSNEGNAQQELPEQAKDARVSEKLRVCSRWRPGTFCS